MTSPLISFLIYKIKRRVAKNSTGWIEGTLQSSYAAEFDSSVEKFEAAEKREIMRPAAEKNQVTPPGSFEGSSISSTDFLPPPKDYVRPEAIGKALNRSRPAIVDVTSAPFPTTTMKASYPPSPEGSPTTKIFKPKRDPLSPGSILGLPFDGDSLSRSTYVQHPVSPVKLAAPAESTAFDHLKGLAFDGLSLNRTDFGPKPKVDQLQQVFVPAQEIDHSIRFDGISTYKSDFVEKPIDMSNMEEAKQLNESQRKASILLV